ncbi:DUF5916 domain-containing protein [Marinicella sp. S1101]|uniref:carbohydrate binding family 9 domain-containing protein n=1 Tax=Marinicella marina TaxID=2996016 RepID=UPI002260E55A|nr:DUF5916 domain-containing protein [Marinicella marina]MCX7554756.1 DUF5916 domain-containing protein [Marinicella marina]MDJ1141428.1 DUF5916 domain-containing protein [Marinicella marina]
MAQTIDTRIDPQKIPVIDATFQIDGKLDEPEWQQALIIPLTIEASPAENIPAMVKTEAYLIDRGDSLLVGFRAEEPEPEKIRAFLRDRDSAFDDDFVGVILDTYNDERRALEFFVNPLGVQMDLILTDNSEDSSWDAIWDSAGKITEFGYVVEMDIPYNELQMPDLQGEKTWGIYVQRTHPRDVRRQYRSVPNDRNNNCFLCQTPKYSGFHNADRGLDLEITPTLTGLSSQSREVTETDYGPSDTDFEAGLDVNWGINSNLTLNATLNPDFSQVEADSAQLNVNNNFALFFPERRSFFLENSDYFDSNMNLVYTRNIADPDYGVRLVGKYDANAYGFYYAKDTITNLLIPGTLGSGFTTLMTESNNLVGRYRRDFGEHASTFGATITSREGGQNNQTYSNTVASADVNYRLTPKDSFRVQFARSETEYPDEISESNDQPDESFTGQYYLAQYNHNGRNWRLNAFHENKDDGFRADSGFISQVGIKRSVIGGGYQWIGTSDTTWNQIDIYSDWDITHDQNDQVLEKEFEGRISIDLPLQTNIRSGLGVRDRFWDDQLFRENFQYANLHMKPVSGYDFGLHLNRGHAVDFANSRLADSKRIDYHFGGNFGRHFNYRVSYVYNNLSIDGDHIFTANQYDIRLSYQFNLRQRLRLALIHTDVNRDLSLYNEPDDFNKNSENLSTQLIYSYKVNPRTLLFVGYSDAGTEFDDIESFVKTDKNVFVKFSYAWKR